MALSCGDDHLDAYADLRIAHMGFRRRQYEQRRVKSEDFRGEDSYQALLQPRHTVLEPVRQLAQSAERTFQGPMQQSSQKPHQPIHIATENAPPPPPPLRARGLNIQFGLSPATNSVPCVSPRLECNEWDAIEERTRLMSQLHTLQAEIVHLARRDNERIGITTTAVAGDSTHARRRRNSSDNPASVREADSLASTSFSSSDTLFEEESDWAGLVAASPNIDEERHLVMNEADLQKLRDFRVSAVNHRERPSVRAAFHQILVDFVVLGRALLGYSSQHRLSLTAVLVVLLAVCIAALVT